MGLACLPVFPTGAPFPAARNALRAGERKRHQPPPAASAFPTVQARVEQALEDGNLPSLEQALRIWHERDPAALAQWLEIRRGNLQRAVFSILAATTPLDAWALADTLESADLKADARDVILETGSGAALPQLAELALSHMGSSGRTGALQSVLSRWALQDPAAAAAWLNDNAVPVEIRDEIAGHLVFQCDAENRPPQTALAWAESISDPAPRYQAVAAAARELTASSPGQADDAIRNSPVLTREEKQSLLTSLSTPPEVLDPPPAD